MNWRTTVLAGLSVSALVLTISGVSVAQEAAEETAEASAEGQEATEEPSATAQETAEGTSAPQPADVDVRRDPKGIVGISPFWEAVVEGDRAYVARSFPSAIEAYNKAIAAEPTNPMGHYRVGQAHVAAGEVTEAEQAYEAALRYANAAPKLKGKILFVIADLRERQQDNAGAIERWSAYGEHANLGDAEGYPATAQERQRVNAKWQELQKKYAEVRTRIQKREKEAEDKLKKSAK